MVAAEVRAETSLFQFSFLERMTFRPVCLFPPLNLTIIIFCSEQHHKLLTTKFFPCFTPIVSPPTQIDCIISLP